MDVRDLFAAIGRLYAANVDLMEEGDKLRAEAKKMFIEAETLRQENKELKMKIEEIHNLKKTDCVDARREEETLKEDEF